MSSDPLESPTARAARAAARRGGAGALAAGDLARHQQGAQAQQPHICFIDAAGCSPLPSVVRTYAPVGPTPVLRDWWTRAHLSAIRAISPAGQRYVHCQDHPINAVDVVPCLEHLRREVPGRLVIMWDGSPIHRRQTIQACLANGAAPRVHLARLPAYAPELNPDEGLWQQLTGVERRHLCCVNLPHLRRERRNAVKRVRRKPRLMSRLFRGAKR